MLSVFTIRRHTHKGFEHGQKCISASAYTSVCQRSSNLCLTYPKRMSAYVCVYQRMSDNLYTLAYASTIRNSVTGHNLLTLSLPHEMCRCCLCVVSIIYDLYLYFALYVVLPPLIELLLLHVFCK
jgi:hypothetical protein